MFVRMLSDKCSYFDFKKKLDIHTSNAMCEVCKFRPYIPASSKFCSPFSFPK